MLQTALQNIYLNVPPSEVGFLMTLAHKMGWEVETKADLLNKYIASRSKNVDLPEEKIMEEVRAVRYAQ
jgi:hypothetical protein